MAIPHRSQEHVDCSHRDFLQMYIDLNIIVYFCSNTRKELDRSLEDICDGKTECLTMSIAFV